MIRSRGLLGVLFVMACASEPAAVQQPAVAPSEPTSGDAQPAPAPASLPFGVTFLRTGSPHPTELAGNATGGDEFADDCAPNAAVGVLVHVRGFLQRAAVLCGEIQMVGGAITTQRDVRQGPERGRHEGAIHAARCPDGHALVGFAGRSGLAMDQLVLHCAPLRRVGGLAAPGEPVATEPVGGPGGEPFDPIACPEGEVAAGVTIRAGDSLDAFGLRCAEMLTRVVLPEDGREYAGERAPAVAEAVAHYDALRSIPYEPVQDATMDEALARLQQRVDTITNHIIALDHSCRTIVQRDRADYPACAELQADARAVFARLILEYRMEPPADLVAQTSSYPRQEHEAAIANFESEMRTMSWMQASRMFCASIEIYEAADTPRARAQLARYGEPFQTYCRDQRAAETPPPAE